MNILVFGGTRLMGAHLVRELLRKGHCVTLANRGVSGDRFGDSVHRIVVDRTDPDAVKKALTGSHWDIVFDSNADCSNDVRVLLETVVCGRYVGISSASVYPNLGLDTKEADFEPARHPLTWCTRRDYPFDEIKRQAECALVQAFSDRSGAMVRFPYVIGPDDYTKRFSFYVEHVVKGIPMYIDNLDTQFTFVRSDEAGRFLAFLGESDFCGMVNSASPGTITLREVLDYLRQKTGKAAILDCAGDAAPYNGASDFSLNTERAQSLGFSFTPLRDWIFDLIDQCLQR